MTSGEERPLPRQRMTNRLERFKPLMPGTGLLLTAKRQTPRTRMHAIRCAIDGLLEAWESQANLRLHVLFGGLITIAGVWCRLNLSEWLWISLCVGLVIIAELLNTTIERLVDLVVGELSDPLARTVKDISAGFVLATCLLAVAIGLFIFGPHLIK